MVFTQEEIAFNTMVAFYRKELRAIGKGRAAKALFDSNILSNLRAKGILSYSRYRELTQRTKMFLKELPT